MAPALTACGLMLGATRPLPSSSSSHVPCIPLQLDEANEKMKRTQSELDAVKQAKESKEKEVKETQMEREAGGAALAKAEARLSFALERLGKSESAQLRHEGFYISAARGPIKPTGPPSREGSPRRPVTELMTDVNAPVIHAWQAFRTSSPSREGSPSRMNSPDKSPPLSSLSEKASRKGRTSAEPLTPHSGPRSRRAVTARKPLKSERGPATSASGARATKSLG